jgi:dTDP-4-dehydrorhamnose reductase
MKTKVLVTGANGQLALTLKDLLSDNTESIDFCFVSKSDLNIANNNHVKDFFEKNNFFNYCINCAAYTNVEQAERTFEDALIVNSEGVKNLAVQCEKDNITLIHISTDYVFDGKKEEPYTEDDVTNPINNYGKSKLIGENHIKSIVKKHFIIRTSWLYSKYGNNFFRTVYEKIKSNTEMKVITSQVGTPTSCVDLSKFIICIIQSQSTSYGTYHFTNSGETNWYEFAKEIARYFNSDVIKPISSFDTIAERPNYSVLNNSKAKSLFGEIQFWKDSVKQMISEYNGSKGISNN